MADSSVDPTKGSAPTDSSDMWSNFLAEVDTALSDINTKLTQALTSDTSDLGVFMGNEATLSSKANEFGGPPPFSKKPDWNEILSSAPPPNSKGVHFYTIIKNVLSLQTLEEDEQAILDTDLLGTIHDAFWATYQAKKPVSQEDYVNWVGTTIINLEKVLDVEHQASILQALNDVIYKSLLNDPSWATFETTPGTNPAPAPPPSSPVAPSSPCAGTGATGIWPEHFCQAVWDVITQNSDASDKIETLTQTILKALTVGLKNYDSNDESSVRDWIETTINGISQNLLSNAQREELIGDLEFSVTHIFPQPDQAYFFKNLQTILFQNIYSADPGQQSPPQASGIEQILDQFFKTNANAQSVLAVDIKSLERSIQTAIKQAISTTFNNLADQGSQGELISATYDRQIISRITNYTTNLLNKLTGDLDLDIPTNGSQSLKAAQDVTAAAVSFREFANSLVELTAAFNGEGGNRQTNKGVNYNNVKQQINGPDNDPMHASVNDLANALYLGTGKPEPLIKQSEFNGVQLAAITAGLQTSLSKLLLSEQSDALTALSNMKQQTTAFQDQKYKDYKQDSDNYFLSLDQYIASRQQFEFDQFSRQVIQASMDDLTALIEKGEINFRAASISSQV